MDLVGIGSAIIDFAPANQGVPLGKVRAFTVSAGGGVSNLIVGAARLGLKTGFIGCIGQDEFGSFILRDFQKEGVDTGHTRVIKDRATGLAFYSVDCQGERQYVFYRFPGFSDPETAMHLKDSDNQYIASSKILHLSESFLRRPQTRNIILSTLKTARINQVLISYDPNIRKELWSNKQILIDTQVAVLNFVDILLATLDEANQIAGTDNLHKTVNKLISMGPSKIVIREKNQYHIATNGQFFTLPVFKVKAEDTSGAGDAFDAGFLTGLIKGWLPIECLKLGNAVAALKVMKVGTRTGLPNFTKAFRFLQSWKSNSP